MGLSLEAGVCVLALKNGIFPPTNEVINSNTLFVSPCYEEVANTTQ